MGYPIKCILIIIVSNCFIIDGLSQNENIPILERNVSVSYESESINVILSDISQQANFVFSYSSDLIDSFEKQSIIVNNKPVRHILNTLFQGKVKYEERGRYLILKEKVIEKNKEMIVEGYLYNSQTGETLKNVSIYDSEKKISSISDDFGYFRMQVPVKESTHLKVSKYGYNNQELRFIEPGFKYVQVELSESAPLFVDSKQRKTAQLPRDKPRFGEQLLPKDLKTNVINISDTIFSQYQFSLFPGLSTNHLLSGNTINKFSFNLTVGYVKGVEILELASIGNIVLEDAGMIQAAGIYNIVGGVSTGLQAAGIFNNSGRLDGMQGAGVGNILSGAGNSLQLAGVYNICNNRFTGLQAAGVLNITDTLSGMQASGVFNHIDNISEGTQIAGVYNIADTITGFQIAGIFNKAKSIKGMQIAGVFNNASLVEGVQIGLINIADTCSGVPIGFFNIIRKGYNKLDLFIDEIFFINVAYRGGVDRFYNIFSAGSQPYNDDLSLVTIGYGIGSTLWKTEKFSFGVETMAQSISKANNLSTFEMLYKQGLWFDLRLTNKTSLFFGASYNFLHTTSQSADAFDQIVPYVITESNFNDENFLKTWMGGRVGVRFF